MAFATSALAQPSVSQYAQGFETNGDWSGTTVARVASGSNGITSKSGGFHAEAIAGDFTRWGGYRSVFPLNGYTTSVGIYLNVGGAFANDTRFDYSSAINDTSGVHRRDFIFNGGFYNDAGPVGAGNRFVVSASNNSPGDPRGGVSPTVISSSGWYTFKHRFYDGGAGVLAVELSIIDSANVTVASWTLSTPSDVIGSTVGGNRYGWFVTNGFPFLAMDDSDRSIFTLASISVSPAGSPTAADNDYTRINDAVQTIADGGTITLNGTFNWTEANAAASWALGSDGISQGGAGDDYTILVPANRNGITFTAASPGAATIQGPGDLPALNLEGVMIFDGGDNQNWTLSNINYFDFDLAIGFFNGAGGTDAFNGTQILNNHIRIARDLNAVAAPGETFQNIGIHYSFGSNQMISGNTIDFSGDDVSNGVNYSSQIGMQSNTSGGAVYNGLQITNNILRVNFAQDAVNPQVILGIWENAHGHSSNISVNGNSFSNLAGGNNPSTNLQRAFRVTSHSSPTTAVTYAYNSVSGANIGFQWYSSISVPVGGQPIQLISNTIRNGATGVLVQGPGLANLSFNRIVGNSLFGVDSSAGTTTANDNWWGCNYGPGATGTGCSGTANGTTGTVTATTWLTLTTSASPNSVAIGNNSTVTSLLTINSASTNTVGSGYVPNGTPATFVGTFGTVTPPSGTTTSGSTGTLFTSTAYGAGGVATTVDGQTVSAAINVTPLCADVSTPVVSSQTTYPALTGVAVSIPVNTTDLTTRGVIAADFTFNYNDTVLSGNPADISVTPGTLSPSAVILINTPASGSVVVSVYDTAGFSGAGPLVYLNMRVIGANLTSTPLTLTNFRYNNTLVCSNVTSGTLNVVSGTTSGKVTFENSITPNIPVPNVTLTAAGSPVISDVTDSNGDYSLTGFGAGPYTVTPTRPNQNYATPNGIFSFDAGLVAQHVVGLITLTGPRLEAAKVSGLPTVSSFEAALIAQWTVNINLPINQTGRWKFTPPTTSPNVNVNGTQDYLALLMGDVDGDWVTGNNRPIPTNKTGSKDAVRASVPTMEAISGSEVIIPFKIDNLQGKQVGSYQFDVQFDPTVLEPQEIVADLAGTISESLSMAANSPQPGLVKVTVYGAIPVGGDGVYVNLRFVTVGAVGTTTPLSVSAFRFNNGENEVITADGQLTVAASNNTTIRGRLVTALGQPVSNGRVTLTSSTGETRSAMSGSFGSFEFGDLVIGETYTVTVQAKRFSFTPRTVSVNGNVTEIDMIADQ